jgi:hypothetical protein
MLMNLEHYRTAFACCCLVLILIILAPMFGTVFPFQRNNERFSELWILGSNHLAEDYPLNVAIGENHNIFVGVSNHMGHSIYYIVYVKLRNQNQTAPSSATSNPSPLAPLYEFHFVIDEGKTWEKPIVFSFPEVSYCEDGLNLTKISINEAIFSIKSLAIRMVEYDYWP